MPKKTTKSSKKGVDSGTQFSPWVKKEEAEKIHKEQVERVVKAKKIKLSGGTVNVYKAEFSEIDQLLDEIRKECRTHGLSDYACTNIRNLLDDTLKKIKLAEN
tara:strand:+ start:2588 stop:2896 length:309 start_codon:yes stop_codon:yes gene_type:complete